MKKRNFFIAAVLLFSFSSCKIIGTLHPLSENQKDFLSKPELTGTWGNPNDKSGSCIITTVPETADKLFDVLVVSEKEDKSVDSSRFYAHLIKPSSFYYLDCWYNSTHLDKKTIDDIETWMVPRHFIFKLRFIDHDNIEFGVADDEELLKLVKAKKINLNIEKLSEDNYLILNKSNDLKKQIVELEKYKTTIYKDQEKLTRLK